MSGVVPSCPGAMALRWFHPSTIMEKEVEMGSGWQTCVGEYGNLFWIILIPREDTNRSILKTSNCVPYHDRSVEEVRSTMCLVMHGARFGSVSRVSLIQIPAMVSASAWVFHVDCIDIVSRINLCANAASLGERLQSSGVELVVVKRMV